MYVGVLIIAFSLCLAFSNLMNKKHYNQIINELYKSFSKDLEKLEISFEDQSESLRDELSNLIIKERINDNSHNVVKENSHVITFASKLPVSKEFVAMSSPDELRSYVMKEFAKQLSEQMFNMNNVFEINELSGGTITDSKVYKITFRLLAKEE